VLEHDLIWITGATRTGKTEQLIRHFCEWFATTETAIAAQPPAELGVLVFAAIGDNRLDLVDRLTTATHGKIPFYSTTPLGFFQDEVTLFWPLLVQALELKAQFPLRLNSETELELATQLWQPELDRVLSQQPTVNGERLVRRILDLLQLSGLAGIPLADVTTILRDGLSGQERELPLPFATVVELLERWQGWCLERGLLTYGSIAHLYWQHLLPHPQYRQQLAERYQVILADDVDEYPAIAQDLLAVLLDRVAAAVLTFNPDGAVRLGLGADPGYVEQLAARCQVVALETQPVKSLAPEWGTAVVDFVMNPLWFLPLSASFQTVQTVSRAEQLQQITTVITEAVGAGELEPRDIAIVGPGLDAIARYSLIDQFAKHHIAVESLNDQRPLSSFPIVRALLTLLALVYVGAGRLIDRAAIAEMLVVLSGAALPRPVVSPGGSMAPPLTVEQPSAIGPEPTPGGIDPVRAGLLADYCFVPHPDRPRLLPPTTFPRWDRLGYQVSEAYQDITQWIATQQTQLEQRLIPNGVTLLDRAIQHFLRGGSALPYNQLAAIRQLLEIAQHYWEVHNRLQRGQRREFSEAMTVNRFIQLLQRGAIAANPYPVRPLGPMSNAVTLATVFQYRSSRRAHRWQFWLDVASPRWLSGVDALFAAPLFLHDWSGRPWTGADTLAANERRLRRILLDLLGRTEERVYLCHSELATNGQEQTGVLLPLVNAATP